jgi:hypothetical protein
MGPLRTGAARHDGKHLSWSISRAGGHRLEARSIRPIPDGFALALAEAHWQAVGEHPAYRHA